MSSDWMAPSDSHCKEALLGSSNVLKKLYNKIYSIRHRQFHASQFFRPVRIVNDADWLLNHEESGQTFESFWRHHVALGNKAPADRPARPQTAMGHYPKHISPKQHSGVKIIYIQPLGNFPSLVKHATCHPFIIWLQTYCAAFFRLAKIRILPAVGVDKVKCEYRVNGVTGRFQLNASGIISYLKKHKPSDAYCVIAVTMIDLFPKPSWDFVFGLASSLHGVGAFSFSRYEDRFYETWTQGKDVLGRLPDGSLDYSPFTKSTADITDDQDLKGILLLRACKVMSHEICHMFGLKHCLYYECLMNGSNHLQESDRRPPFLCPVCLRKLQAVLEFDVVERYQAMINWATTDFWDKHVHQDHKTDKTFQRNTPSLWGRRGSLPDAMKPRSSLSTVASQHQKSQRKSFEKRPASSRPGSSRSKPALTKSVATRRPVSSLPRSTTTLENRAKPADSVQAAKSQTPKGFKPPSPPLDAFNGYSKWLDDVINFLENDK